MIYLVLVTKEILVIIIVLFYVIDLMISLYDLFGIGDKGNIGDNCFVLCIYHLIVIKCSEWLT